LTLAVTLQELIRSLDFLMTSTDKAIPVQAYYRPRGFQKLRLPDFETVGTKGQ